MYEPELANVLMILKGIPRLLHPNTPLATTWALHVTPAGPIGGPLHPETNSYLSVPNFVDWLFYLNAVIWAITSSVDDRREIDLRGVVRMDKTQFHGLLIVKLFKALTKLVGDVNRKHTTRVVGCYTAETTAILAARLPSHPMKYPDELVPTIYNFCASAHGVLSDIHRGFIFPVLALLRDTENHQRRVKVQNVEWLYDALEDFDASLHLKSCNTEDSGLQRTYVELFKALVYYEQGNNLNGNPPPIGALGVVHSWRPLHSLYNSDCCLLRFWKPSPRTKYGRCWMRSASCQVSGTTIARGTMNFVTSIRTSFRFSPRLHAHQTDRIQPKCEIPRVLRISSLSANCN
ncbi:hypothetical protein DFH09DRAFT_1355854, partial [Mycena vulgaris]